MSNDIQTKLKIEGMHCTSCAINIDGELEDTNGVREAKTNYAKQELEIKFDPDLISIDNIISIIKKIDVSYNASEIIRK